MGEAEIYQNVAWIRGFRLQGEIGLTWNVFTGKLRGDFIEKHKWGRWSEPFSQGGNIQHVGHSYKVRWGLFQRRYAGQVVFKSIGHLLLYLVFEAAEVCST